MFKKPGDYQQEKGGKQGGPMNQIKRKQRHELTEE